MSHSVVKDFPTEKDDTLILVVNKNGELSVDRETLDSYARLNTQVSIIRVDGEDGDAVEMTVDAFREADMLGEIAQVNTLTKLIPNPSRLKELTVIDDEDEMAQNYNSFLNDHCYTILTSPIQQQKTPTLPDDDELDDLAHTLSILDGDEPVKTIKEVIRTPQVIKAAVPKVESNKERVEPSDKVTLLNKVNSKLVGTPGHKVYKGVKTVVKSVKVVKKVEQPTPVDSDSEDDDLKDSDYEIESPSPRNKGTQLHHQQKKVYSKRKTKPVEHQEAGGNEVRNKVVKVRKGVKHIVYKPASPQKPALTSAEPPPVTPTNQTLPQTPEPVKSPDVKKVVPPKKDKKIPKPPIDDGIALFSTPDIIRRVGGDKQGTGGSKIESPESPTKIKPAKIEDRSKSESGRNSVDGKPKLPHRHSLDSNKAPSERRPGDKQEPPPIANHVDESFDKISEAVGNLENDSPPVNQLPSDSVPQLVPTLNAVLPIVEPSQMNLDEAAAAIGMDQNILDNISPDELIPEDILYQVAKLVENPDVQNVIDRTLVDGSLTLDPMQTPLTPPQPITQTTQVTPNNQQILLPTNPNPAPQIACKTTPKPIQIIRSDGRVVTLPPIEKPATRSSKKKQESPPQAIVAPIAPQALQLQPQLVLQNIAQQQQQHVTPKIHPQPQQQSVCLHPQQKPPQTLPTPTPSMGDVVEHDDLLSDSDESWNSEDDPDRLWCICKQPHNNRFMICCDTCEDWFHGKCVNVTKAMGQLMEQQGKEWMCPNCIKKAQMPIASASPHPSTPTQPAKLPPESAKRKSTDGPSCIVCGNISRANSVYCSDTCILKHAQGVEKQNLVQSKLQLVKNPQGREGIGLAVNRKGIQVGVMPHTAKHGAIKLIPAAKMAVPGTKPPQPKKLPETPPPKLKVQPTLKSPPVKLEPPKIFTSTPKPKQPRERKQKLIQTPENPKPQAQENIRETVKKTLNEQLLTRLKEVEDIKLTEEEVDKMANDIETQLYKLFGDSGPKYRTKYRSLIFNIKDTKNQTLWRRICEKSIAPYQLVRLSPEEMASQELAMWRERENKHQLDMIKKSELEMLTINRTYVLKTHKGEQVMEDRTSAKVDSTEIMPGLGADSTSEPDASEKTDKLDASDRSSDKKSSSKHSRRDKDRRSSKDRARERSNSKDRKNSSSSVKDHSGSTSKSKSSKRSRSRDHSSHRSDRKRSRSRDRHHRSSHKSSRHKREKHSTEHLDKKSREILSNLENNKIIAPPEDRLWKHVPQQDIQVVSPDSDSDHEPTSTVTIPTPPRSTEQEDSLNPIGKKEDVPEPSPPKTDDTEDTVEKIVKNDPRSREQVKEIVKSESPEPPITPPSGSPVPVSPSNSNYTSESKETIVWDGNITMVDVAKFSITLHEVSGDCSGLGTELPSTLEIVGRIPPDTVWDYVGKMRRSNSKVISILRLTACNVEEQMPYIALYMYLNSRTRFGVIKSTNNAVKDFYIMPLASHAPVPQALLPLSGPGFEESRPHLLLGIIVRAKRKRSNTMDIISNTSIKRSRVENSPTISTPSVSSTLSQPAKSYTPPPTRDPRIKLPAVPATANDDDEPYSPEDSDPESTTPVVKKPPAVAAASTPPPPLAAPVIKADLASVLSTLKNATFLEPPAVTAFEPFNNKFDAIPGLDVSETADSIAIARKIEELNKCIEQEKEQIDSMSQNLVCSGAAASMATNLSNISLPSNLQQILDSIKKIPSTGTGQESSTEEYCPSAPGYKTSTDELTIPLLLPKLNARSLQASNTRAPPPKIPLSPPEEPKLATKTTISLQLPVASTPRDSQIPPLLPATEQPIALPNLTIPPPAFSLPVLLPPAILPTVAGVALPNTSIPPPTVINTNLVPPNIPTIAFNLKPKVSLQPPAPPIITPAPQDKPISVLSSLSEEELIRKAAEMLGEAETAPEEDADEEEDDKIQEINQTSFKSAPVLYTPTPVAPTPPKRAKIDTSQPPVPGLEDVFDS